MTPNAKMSVIILSAALLLPASLVLAEDSLSEGDLSIFSTVVVQVVPDPRGIVVNKSAVLRLTVISTFPDQVNANISVTYDHSSSVYVETGPEGTGVPMLPGVNVVYVPGGNCTGHAANWSSEPATLLWTHEGLDAGIMAEVDPDGSVVETDETNNQRATNSPLDVWASRPLRMLVVPLLPVMFRSIYDSYPFEFSLDEELQEVLEMYPLADDGLEVVQAPPRYEIYDPSLVSTCREVTLGLSAEARMLGYDRVVAVLPYVRDRWGFDYYGSAVGVLQEPRDPVPIYVTGRGIVAREALIAHELGHTYYLWHPHDIGVCVYGATRWSVVDREFGLSANTFMCYPDSSLPVGIPLTPRWVDEERYQDHTKSYIDLSTRYISGPEGTWEWNLFSQLVSTPPTLGPIVVIEGSILENGAALIDKPWFIAPEGVFQEQMIPQQGPVGSYSVRMLDYARNPLGTTYFNVSLSSLFHDEGVTDMYSEEECDRADFLVSAQHIPGTRYVQVVDPSDVVLAERVVSSSVPTVQVLSPDGGADIEIGHSYEISWAAEDADGDPLSCFISYTQDGGNSWIPIASDVNSSSYTWNTSGVGPTTECRVRVMASDGFNTAEDVSDQAFEMTDSSPPTTRAEFDGALGEEGWYVSSVNVSLIALDNSRVSWTEYSLDDGPWTEYASGILVQDEGVTTLQFRSRDLSGNVEAVKSATLGLDLVGPAVSVVYPDDGSTVRGDLTFSWTASDAVSGVARCEVRLNSGTWVDVGAARDWQVEGLMDGVNTLEVRATDHAGNNASALVEVISREPAGLQLWMLALVGAVAVAGAALGAHYWRRGRG